MYALQHVELLFNLLAPILLSILHKAKDNYSLSYSLSFFLLFHDWHYAALLDVFSFLRFIILMIYCCVSKFVVKITLF